MSCKELIDSLRKAADERTGRMWKDAEAEAERVRIEAAARIEALRADAEKKKTDKAREALAQSLSQARNKARIIRLTAEKDVAARLYAAALSCLPGLRKGGAYAAIFDKLARELPALPWQTVRVHPDDISLARRHFPGSEVIADASISGGLDASTADEAIRIINTFEKRLQRAWGEIEPVLIRDLYREVNDGTPPASAGPGISARISGVQNQGEEVPADRGLETVDL